MRFPTALYDKLKDSAGEASVNAEVIARLEASFQPPIGGGLFGLGAELVKAEQLLKEFKELNEKLEIVKALTRETPDINSPKE